MKQSVCKVLLLLGFCFGFSQAEICYRKSILGTYHYSFYCCGYCSGLSDYEYCNDDGFTYSYSYYDCYYFWAGGSIAGVVIGTLAGIAITVAVIIFLCRLCARRQQQPGHIFHATPAAGVTVVSSNNSASSYPGYPSMQTYPQGQSTSYPPYPTTANYGQPQPPEYKAA